MRLPIVVALIIGAGASTYTLGDLSRASNPITSGRVIESVPGFAYINGREGKIVSVETSSGLIHVFVPSKETKIGEELTFSGPVVTVADWKVVDSTEGGLYRPAGRTAQEQIEDQMAIQAVQEQKHPANTIIGDELLRAVPTTVVETKEQRNERRLTAEDEARDKRLNIVLSVLGILLGLLAIERLPKLFQMLVWGVHKIWAIICASSTRVSRLLARRR